MSPAHNRHRARTLVLNHSRTHAHSRQLIYASVELPTDYENDDD